MAGQRRPVGWMIMETTNANRSCMRYTNGRHGLLSGGKPFGHIQAARESGYGFVSARKYRNPTRGPH